MHKSVYIFKFPGVLSSFLEQIVTASRLDREKNDAYILSISCRDFGTDSAGSRTSMLQLSVRVSDENDNSPVFERSVYTAEVQENSVGHVVVASVTAVDRDIGPNGDVRYALEDDVSGLLSVDERTGDVTCITSLDHEVVREIDVYLNAVDQGMST